MAKYIPAEVRRVVAMAIDRQSYIDNIEHRLTGAFMEFCKATIATNEGQTTWVQHWTTEWKGLLKELLQKDLLRPTKGWKDKQKAAKTAIANFRRQDLAIQKSAARVVRSDFTLAHTPAVPTAEQVELFYTAVQEKMALAFGV